MKNIIAEQTKPVCTKNSKKTVMLRVSNKFGTIAIEGETNKVGAENLEKLIKEFKKNLETYKLKNESALTQKQNGAH